ncbi:MAG: folylpolyglutamate synthase/dihydrofolate synthase family protein [Thermodesulfobacteriota bacterium]
MAGHPFERLSYDLEYDQGLSYLYNLQKFGMKFGLSKTENLLRAFNNPEKHLRMIHVAGSNGKGSVAAMLSSIYSQAGYRVGLFTSPHLIDFRERFRINGRMIEKDRTLELIREVKERTDPKEPPTFFEFVTAMALLYFYREKVDLAIMEVGLGGRLDSTNIIEPLITVITTISLEHQEYLGKTLEKITLEKAGIIKPHVPLVTGVEQKKVQRLLDKVCHEKQAPMLLAGRDFKTRKVGQGRFNYLGFYSLEFGVRGSGFGVGEGALGDQALVTPNSKLQTPNYTPIPQHAIRNPKLKGLRLALLGDHQIRNAGLALTVIDCLEKKFLVNEEAIRDGLSKVAWPGRMEVLSERPWIVLDGAHNPGAMKTLVQNLPRVFSYKRLLLIIGMMRDKDIEQTFKYVIPESDIVFLTRAEYDRSADPETLRPFVEGESLPCGISNDIPTAIQRARLEAEPEDLILITGSLFIVGEARAWWEREGLRSPFGGIKKVRGGQIY